jgi:hypothetical protein
VPRAACLHAPFDLPPIAITSTCHDAADDEAGGKIKERRRSGKVNMLANEVYGPSNQINNAADGSLGDGQGALSQRSRQADLQALAFQLGWDIVMAHLADSRI